MIAPATSQKFVRNTPSDPQKEYSREEAQELLRSLMTEKFSRWLMKKALAWTNRDWQRAQDLVQETFLALLKCRSYDPNKSSPCFYAVWRMRAVLCGVPSAGSRLKAGSLASEPVSRSMAISPERQEIVAGMQRAIDQLPAIEHAVIVHRMSGMTLQGIAVQKKLCRERIRQIEEKAMNRLADMPLPV